jgi:hypothetical protein
MSIHKLSQSFSTQKNKSLNKAQKLPEMMIRKSNWATIRLKDEREK